MTVFLDCFNQLDDKYRRQLRRPGGLSEHELNSLISRPDADPAAYHPDHPSEGVISNWNDVTLEDELRGEEAIKAGDVAFVVMAGGMGTRQGGPKAFLQLPEVGTSLLGWKLLQAGDMPVWLMSSPSLTKEIQRHVSSFALPMGLNGVIFEQFEGCRLLPDNTISLVMEGVPDMYPLGHGDVGPALIESGVLDDNQHAKYVVICNVDNVLASPHAGLIGRHIRNSYKVTCELVERLPGDQGGVPVWVNNQLQIAETFRLPENFADESKFHNTNTMIIDVDVLRMEIPWRWHRVRKQVGSRLVIQYERLLQQYTEECATNFIHVPREARYLGIKTAADLSIASNTLSKYRFK